MKRLALLWVWLVCTVPHALWAQEAAVVQPAAQTARQRIDAERARSDAEFARQEQECYTRFVVQSCLDQAAAQHRKLERELKRQEAVLNAADRKQRAQEQLQSSDEKARDFAARTAEPSGDAAADRLQAQQDKAQAHRKVAPSPSPSAAASKPVPDAPADQAALRESYAAKQRAAQERRAARDKRLRESGQNAPALPLPQ